MDFSNVGQVLLRMIAIFFVALVVVRLMGNRTVGQFSPFDFVLMVGIGDIVGNIALDKNQGILTGIEALFGIFLLQQTLAWSSLKNIRLRKLFEGAPMVLIENGQVNHQNLVKTQFNLDDLRQELHKQGLDFSNLQDIKMARLESCGDFSIIKQPNKEPLTKSDFYEFVQSLTNNPLSQPGSATVKIDQLAEDIKVIADHLRRQNLTDVVDEKKSWDTVNKTH